MLPHNFYRNTNYPTNVTPRNDPEHERTEFSEKVDRRERYLQGG